MKTNFRKEKDDDFDVSKSHTISKSKTEKKSTHERNSSLLDARLSKVNLD